jgi:hypothetical protein
LEEKYNKIVKDLCLVRLHPDAEEYHVIQLPKLKIEIQELFKERKNNINELEKV